VSGDAIHRYRAECSWTGSTAAGWEEYDRAHTVTAPPAKAALTITTGESHGDPDHLNPEQLLVAAASSCQLLWFLHVAARARLDVQEYVDRAEGVMPENDAPLRITRVTLRPRIRVAGDADEARVRHLVELAHRHCYIANSLTSEVVVEPEIELVAAADGDVRR
jgi:organic hydroperoxide reductase OsmC/OhrA